MKVFIILSADDTDYSTQYGYSNVVAIKYRENDAKNKIEELKQEDNHEYYYEELYISLSDIPNLGAGHQQILREVDSFNVNEQCNDEVIKSHVIAIENLKKQISELKSSVAYEKKYAVQQSARAAKAELELSNIRKAAKAERKKNKPRFLGFEDSEGLMYHIDPNQKNTVFFDYMGSRFYKTIEEVRRVAGALKPIYEEKSE